MILNFIMGFVFGLAFALIILLALIWNVNKKNMIQRKSEKWGVDDGSPRDKTEDKNYEQLKREVITIISDDGFITPNQTLTEYRNKLKLIIDVL